MIRVSGSLAMTHLAIFNYFKLSNLEHVAREIIPCVSPSNGAAVLRLGALNCLSVYAQLSHLHRLSSRVDAS